MCWLVQEHDENDVVQCWSIIIHRNHRGCAVVKVMGWGREAEKMWVGE